MYFYLDSERVLTLKQLSELLDLSEQKIIDFSIENNINIIETLEKNIKNKHDIRLINRNPIKLFKRDDVKKIIKHFDEKLSALLFDNHTNNKVAFKTENENLKNNNEDLNNNNDEIILINYNGKDYIYLHDLSFLAGLKKHTILKHISRKNKKLTKVKKDNLNKLDDISLVYFKNKKIKFGNKLGAYILNLEEAEEITGCISVVKNNNLSNDLKLLFKMKRMKKNKYKKPEIFENYTKLCKVIFKQN